jgi:hypothetical protein
MIDQRNSGASTNNTNAGEKYSLDRWNSFGQGASIFSMQQNAGSVTPPAGFVNYLGITSLAATSISNQNIIFQPIEGLNVADLNWGTANAAAVTISFWVRSSLTGSFGGSLRNSAVNRSYPFGFTISAANTWEQKSVTVAGDTTGTWLTTNGVGIYLTFDLGSPSGNRGTAGSWAAANYVGVTGATSVVGTSGATFYITGVQLEKGSVATPFEYRPYGQELALCQRYAFVNSGALPAGYWTSGGSNFNAVVTFPVSMRTAPAITLKTAGTVVNAAGNDGTITSVAIGNAGLNSARLAFTGITGTTGTITAGMAGFTSGHVSLFDSEL